MASRFFIVRNEMEMVSHLIRLHADRIEPAVCRDEWQRMRLGACQRILGAKANQPEKVEGRLQRAPESSDKILF